MCKNWLNDVIDGVKRKHEDYLHKVNDETKRMCVDAYMNFKIRGEGGN